MLTGELLPEARPFCTSGYNPLGEARERYLAGDRDEAIWLHFVATLIGWERPDSVDRFLRVLGGGQRATWCVITAHPLDAIARIEDHAAVLIREAPFGNHRKYETHRGDGGSARVVKSFIDWAEANPSARIDAIATTATNPEHAFDRLFNSLKVYRFGRTARYDFARLLANLDARLKPGCCYLQGASGPRRGAALLFLGRPWARDGELSFLEDRCRELAQVCGLDLQVIEDAVCQWQKTTPSARVEQAPRNLARAS
ncbi:MAG: hypothetical protein WD359_04300 [Dehalococcoidia bacterium]